jgi:hypothetical protein
MSGSEPELSPEVDAPDRRHVAVSTLFMATILLVGVSIVGAINYVAFLDNSAGIVAQMLLPIGSIDVSRRNIINAATLNGFYLYFVFFALLFSLLFGFYYKYVLRGSQDANAAKAIAVCIGTIVGSVFAISSPLLAPYLDVVRVFENTVGFFVLQITHATKLRTVADLMYTNDAYARAVPLPGAAVSHSFIATLFDIFEFRKTLSLLGHSGQSVFDFHSCGDQEICTKAFGDYATANVPASMSQRVYEEDLAARRADYDPVILAALKIARGTMSEPREGGDAREFWIQSSVLQDTLARELANMVVLKHSIGHLCWVYFGSLAASLVALKYLAKIR